MNRRDFLKTIGAALAAAAVPPLIPKEHWFNGAPKGVWRVLGKYRGGVWVGKETASFYCYKWSDGEDWSAIQVYNNGSGLEKWFKINFVVD